MSKRKNDFAFLIFIFSLSFSLLFFFSLYFLALSRVLSSNSTLRSHESLSFRKTQMDSVEVNGQIMDTSEGASAKNSVSPEGSDICDVFGDPEILPRVGDEYQVEIPSLITVSEYLRLSKDPTDLEITTDDYPNCLIGMSIPLIWISEEKTENQRHGQEKTFDSVSNNKDESLKSECVKEASIVLVGGDFRSKVELEPLDVTSINGTKIGEFESSVLQRGERTELQQSHGGIGHHLVPGCLDDNWSDQEEAVFLLGLYIFRKNLVLVKKFVGSKKMGDILSYYYGRFYRSNRYRRWSECRKIRSRRSIYGQRIFTGLRHQELLSRLLSHVSEECKNTVLEVSKTYGEGKISLEEYVFTLKSTFGLKALVEAVGIGKGKQDLTGVAMDIPKSNQIVHIRPEIPIGKACSALTPLEIINFLTGDFRLSKARSSDLFWEAVWPRLLARGWHSEQPNNHGFTAGSKHSLVFLLPGIKKFSRRKLVKGDHYFDSVSDVLSKVASDPGLLEIEGYKSKEENGWSDETKLEQEDFPNEQRHCYLKPRTRNHATDAMKFTVVDTSMVYGRTGKVRELRSLPSEIMNTCTSESKSEDDEGDSSEESVDKSSSVNALSSDKHETSDLKAAVFNLSKSLSFGNKDVKHGADSTIVPAKIQNDKHTDLCNGVQPKKGAKSKLGQKEGPENIIHLAPVSKRRRKLPPPSRKEMSCNTINSKVHSRLQQEANSCVENSDLSENVLSQVDPSLEKLSSTSSSRGCSPISSAEGILSGNCTGAEQPLEKPPSRTFIDLNIPVSPDAETYEPFASETTARQDQQSSKESDSPQRAGKASEWAANSEQEANVGPRRQSTRNRPLTTKVLEAFAYGYMDTKQKRKAKDSFPGENKSRCSRTSRPRLSPQESLNSANVDFAIDQSGTVQNTNGDVFNKLGISSQTG